jgi:hypothetical protein
VPSGPFRTASMTAFSTVVLSDGPDAMPPHDVQAPAAATAAAPPPPLAAQPPPPVATVRRPRIVADEE